MSTWRALFVTANLVLLVSCASEPEPKRILQSTEEALGTDGSITMHYHSALYYPEEIALRNTGYLVGIEKGDPDKILQPGEKLVFKNPNTEDEAVKNKQEAVQDGKIMFVSHVVRDQPPGSTKPNCSIYNAYYRPKIKDLTLPPCDPKEPRLVVAPADAYRSSWLAMDELQRDLGSEIAARSYTHIVVVVMGWNTVQEEAVRNINSIVRSIRTGEKIDREKSGQANKAARFNPIVIGVTWPSQWNSAWVDPLYKLASFDTKARDADEVGLTWLGTLLETTIPGAQKTSGKQLPVVVIGHSFGARAASTAGCSGPVISKGAVPQSAEKPPVDLLISYQGAFLVNRLLGSSEDGGFSLGNRCPHAKNIVMTSSRYDGAVKRAFWGDYAGNNDSFDKYCFPPSNNIACLTANAQGEIKDQPGTLSRISYINADNLIFYNAFYSGGGAHSDIYRDEHGVLTWSFIKRITPFEVGDARASSP